MSELIEFDDFLQVELLVRAAVLLKFGDADELEMLAGSPIFGHAVQHLRRGLVDGLRESGSPGKSEKLDKWYQLSFHVNKWDAVARRVAMHPKWNLLSVEERKEYVSNISAPLSVDEPTFNSIAGLVEDFRSAQSSSAGGE
jgi:hypothetical protein